MLQAIKVKNYCIMLNQIVYVQYSMSDCKVSLTNGTKLTLEYDARDQFEKQFDALTGIAETEAVAEPVAAPETGTLRDALPFLYTGGLEKLDEVLSKIIGSDAPVSAKSEAKILKQTVRKELNQRFDNLLKD